MFKTIVVGLDGTEASNQALALVKGLAQEQHASVHAVHVIEHVAGRGGGLMHLDEKEILGKIDRQVQQLRDAGIDVEQHICSSMLESPAHEIATIADARHADLVVTGTRGHTGLTGTIVGSVSHRLVHLAHCPVLIVPAKATVPASAPEPAAQTAAG